MTNVGDLINLFINEILLIWTKMSEIEFLGTNLLVFVVTISILSALIPLLITTVQVHKTSVGREIKRR